jgi:hypothetical protein
MLKDRCRRFEQIPLPTTEEREVSRIVPRTRAPEKQMSDNNNNNTSNAARSSDPLKDLETRIASDQSIAFEPEVISALAELRDNDRVKYELLRVKLQNAGFRRMTVLEKAMDAVSGTPDKPPSQADILTEIVNSAELFHTPDTTSYADVTVNNHRETLKVRF